jgi:hypothetical protein
MVAVNLDLPATLFELAGLPPVGDGRSLVPLLEGRNPPWRETLLIESWTATQSWSGLRIDDARGRWKYVENTRSFKELYDLERDPFELANLADQPAQAAFVAQLAAELAPQKGLASRTPSAPNGRVGAPYARSLVAWGGSPPYTWRLFEGTLPPGLQVGSSPALLSGTPRAAGTWSFVLEVADASTNTTHGGPQRYRQPLELRILAACADGVDNDGDGRVDYPADPGCANAQGYVENPRCNDGIDNDGDGKIDFDGNPPDPNCTSAWLNHEEPSTSCGLGFELVLVLAPLAWVWGRRRVGPAGVPS